MIPPYPLRWPEGIRRTQRHTSSQFRTSLPKAMQNVSDSLRRFSEDSGHKVTEPVITSNAALGQMRPADPGVAVWFTWDGSLRCIAVDRYGKVEDNLQAIHHVLEARRTEIRHAGIEVARATFKGFTKTLPAPDGADGQHWSAVLGVPADAPFAMVQEAYRGKARYASQAGDQALLQRLNIARDQARKEIGDG